ncbi:LysM peptidoglycan-binding domain-containing protein [Paenibacillus sp. NPDC058177]|uniref:LysM peptidoglycan-binding domain-containing protein n=1 Tax=Paenibacillus sp. NPDC058177 TaxID=3346369 RepID=UPI0036D9EAFB
MFDQSHGLRFDIYERIHLPAELPGIAELEEVELLPDIQVIQREDRAELYGQLLLTGLYRSEDDVTQRLDHAIPVEITVPLTRISSLEDIGVEIENFDIDLLTMRTVNITGVLSLRGIEGTEAVPAWQEEEYTVAYSSSAEQRPVQESAENPPEGDALYENSIWTFGEGAAEETSIEERENTVASADNLAFTGAEPVAFAASPEPVNAEAPAVHSQGKAKEPRVFTHSLESTTNLQSGNPQFAETQFTEAQFTEAQFTEAQFTEAQFTEAQSTGAPSAPADNWLNSEHWNREETGQPATEHLSPEVENNAAAVSESNAEVAKEPSQAAVHSSEQAEANQAETAAPEAQPVPLADSVSHESEASPEEKQDLKVALGSKKEEAAKEKEHLTFSSLLSSSKSRKEQEVLQAEESVSEDAAVPEVGNDTEWKSRFISSSGSSNLFRKVRLCIVQREETLDTIAEKYQLSARELGLYNRLSGQNVEEGQVLYIP